MGNRSLFDDEERKNQLSKLGNPLQRLSKVIDFEMFREDVEEILLNRDKEHGKRGAPHNRAGKIVTQEDASGYQTFFLREIRRSNENYAYFCAP